MLNMMMRASGARSRMRRASSKPETVGRLMSITQRSGRSTMKTHSPLLGVGGLQHLDLAFVGQHGAAAGSDDGMIVDDQNAHRRSP